MQAVLLPSAAPSPGPSIPAQAGPIPAAPTGGDAPFEQVLRALTGAPAQAEDLLAALIAEPTEAEMAQPDETLPEQVSLDTLVTADIALLLAGAAVPLIQPRTAVDPIEIPATTPQAIATGTAPAAPPVVAVATPPLLAPAEILADQPPPEPPLAPPPITGTPTLPVTVTALPAAPLQSALVPAAFTFRANPIAPSPADDAQAVPAESPSVPEAQTTVEVQPNPPTKSDATQPDLPPLPGPPLTDDGPLAGAFAVPTTATSGAAPGATTPPTPSLIAPQIIAGLADLFLNRTKGPVEITLSPQELGRVRLSLSQDGDGLTVTVRVERIETLDLLRRNADVLLSEIRAQGFSGADLSFTGWSGGERHMAKETSNLPVFATNAPVPEAILPTPPSLPSAGLHLRL